MSRLFFRRSQEYETKADFRWLSVSCGCACTLTVPNRRFQIKKRAQLCIGAHNETLSVVAMRVCNPDCPAFGINI